MRQILNRPCFLTDFSQRHLFYRVFLIFFQIRSLTVSDFNPEHPSPDLEGTVWGQRRKIRRAFNIPCWISRDEPLSVSCVWFLNLALGGKPSVVIPTLHAIWAKSHIFKPQTSLPWLGSIFSADSKDHLSLQRGTVHITWKLWLR